jgi:hypothetical protein
MRVIDDRASRRDPGTFTRMTEPELAELDASLGRADGGWWNGFYQDRAKPCLLAQKPRTRHSWQARCGTGSKARCSPAQGCSCARSASVLSGRTSRW